MSRQSDAEYRSAKQLASIYGRHISWIYAARSRGFRMPGGRAKIESLVEWLESNGAPRGNARNRVKMR